MAKQKWYNDPKIAEDPVYWKPKTQIWFWAAVLALAAVLAVTVFIPSVEDVKEPRFYQAILAVFVAVLLFLYFYTLGRPDTRKKLFHKAQFILAGGLTLAIWELLTTKSAIFPLPYFPGFAGIFSVMYDDRFLLLRSTLYSMRLFFVGMITGTVLGLVTGILIGWNRQWDYWLSPIIKVTGIIPAVAWLPVALAILPSSFTTGIFLIFISSWFPVSSMMAAGIIATPKSFFDVAKTLGADNRFLLVRIAIPHAMPSMFTGIMTATAFSFTTLIVSEMVGAKAGLGYYINWAKGWGAYSKVYAAIIIIAVEFALILALIGAIRSSVLRWQRGILK
ncbi:ABC transporter permease [Leadbettera azotonutricia]|uniref:ABC transporter, permease protein n=1 Tax=Leadbettera azotonutricia (strain ATCC BAA-888 / DSM 13862 / ZAS-9) TaxID=545695 RepID=F5YEL0_LEAAZ|nr:ABC transporter permease subunit [Leadbettera azotonutricia]AEF80757.1 ABC transporter, permease protein [Leadbettera azotonutricia ZAS-9]